MTVVVEEVLESELGAKGGELPCLLMMRRGGFWRGKKSKRYEECLIALALCGVFGKRFQ